MKVLCVYDGQNTFWGTLKRLKKDGDEFRRQAGIAAKYYSTVTQFSLPRGTALEKRQALFRWLRTVKTEEFDRILFFMHGAPFNLNRKMISDVNINTFCTLISDAMAIKGGIVFFSCKTAKRPDGFAFSVAEKAERDVIGHTTSGHTTRNPYKLLVFAGGQAFERLWVSHGGVKALGRKLRSAPASPFIFVEKILR